MHVGYTAAFQNPFNQLPDDEVYAHELRFIDQLEDLGFDSVWTVEHHFDDYTMCPDPVQLLTWVAGRTSRLRLGTGVIVLPWHDPMRIAENIAQLDNLSDGRLILGLGRGLARIEYEGFRVDMNTSRERLVEYSEVVLNGLEQGYLEHHGQFIDQPRREIRPRPRYSFRGRTYAAAVSPESMPIMARLGIGLLIIPQKPWEVVRKDFDVYHQVWKDVNGDQPAPAPICGGSCFVDRSADRAEEMAHRWMGAQYESVLRHYEFESAPHEGVKGYEFYTGITKYIGRHGTSGAVNDYVNLMPYGTPEQVLEKLEVIRGTIGMAAFTPGFSYGGMPYDEAERSMRLFVDEVMPELKSWDTEPMAPVERAGLTGIAAG